MNKKHLRHVAKANGGIYHDCVAVMSGSTIAECCDLIRNRVKKRGVCTKKQARERYDAAKEIVAIYRRQHKAGEQRRRNRQMPEPQTIEQRKTAAIRKLLLYTFGGHYSGKTTYDVGWHDSANPHADTTTERGEQYSRRCTFHRQDACHAVRCRLDALMAARRTPVPHVIDEHVVLSAKSVRDAVYRIDAIKTTNKRITSVIRYVADQGDDQWHLAKTERGAVTALNRAARQREAVEQGILNAAVVRQWGWCVLGIRQWLDRHNIRRDLQARLRRGTTAVALARLIVKHGGPHDGYERRIMQAAGQVIE